MKAKTLLLAVALSAAGIATSMAQVYSVNIVGYANVTVRPGYSLIANQFVAGSPAGNLNAVLPAVPEESQVLKFTGGSYSSDIFLGGAWFNATSGDPSVTLVNPGDGFFFLNPAAQTTITMVGEVKTGSSTVTMVPGYTLISSPIPQPVSLVSSNGFNATEEMQYLTFDSSVQNYNTALIFLGGEWLNSITGDPTDARPDVGQGFFVLNPAGGNNLWTRNFVVPTTP